MEHYVQTRTPNFKKAREMETIQGAVAIIKGLAWVGINNLHIVEFRKNHGKYLKYKRK